jgi:hypothetical protein
MLQMILQKRNKYPERKSAIEIVKTEKDLTVNPVVDKPGEDVQVLRGNEQFVVIEK